MKTQWEIEHEWDVAKLLVTKMNYKLLLFHLPQYGLYVQRISPIFVTHSKTPRGLGFHFLAGCVRQQPHIVSVRSKYISRVVEFIQECPEFQASRIFKHGMYFHSLAKEHVIGIVCEATKNMLHLYPRKTFYITSKDKKLRQIFYEKAVEINEEDDLGCSFDYDEYDYTLEIRAYKRFKEERLIAEDGNIVVESIFRRWAVVTILYGKDLPNSWNMGDRKRGEL